MKIAPDLQVHARPMSDLIPLPDNSRRGDIPALAESLRRFGQRKPIVVDGDNVIIAGNHIYHAAALIDATDIAAVGAEDLSAEDRRAYVLADNRLSDLGGYDVEMLAAQLAAAAEDAAGLLGTGYDPEALAMIQQQAIDAGDGWEPPPPEPPTPPRMGVSWEVTCPNCAHVFTVEGR